jgi:outer membrane protein TolC
MKKIALLLLVTSSLHAQTNSDLSALVTKALEYSPALKAQKTLIRVGDTKTEIQRSLDKPIIAYEAGITRIDPVSKVTFAMGGAPSVLQFQPNMNYNTNFVASQTLYDWGKNKIAIEKSQLETRLSKTQIEQSEFAIAYQIATVYHQIVFLQNVLNIQEAELARIKSQSQIIDQQVKLGEALQLDAMSLKIRIQNQETKIGETKMQVGKLTDYLETQTGQSLKNGFKPIQTIIQSNETVANNPLFAQLDVENAVWQQEIQLQDKASAPTLSGAASLGLRNGYLPRINGEVPAFSDDFKINTMVGLKLNVPIYSGKRASMQKSIAQIQQERINYQREDTNNKLTYDIRQGDSNLKTIQAKLATQHQLIEQAKYAYQLAEARYKVGTIKQMELDQVQNTLEEAQLQEENFKLQLKLQQLDLLKTKGVKFWEL